MLHQVQGRRQFGESSRCVPEAVGHAVGSPFPKLCPTKASTIAIVICIATGIVLQMNSAHIDARYPGADTDKKYTCSEQRQVLVTLVSRGQVAFPLQVQSWTFSHQPVSIAHTPGQGEVGSLVPFEAAASQLIRYS